MRSIRNEGCERLFGSSPLSETRSPRRHSHSSPFGRAQPRIEPVNPNRTVRWSSRLFTLDHLVAAIRGTGVTEYQADSFGSLQFDPRKLDHLGPFLSIRGYEFS